MRRSNTDKLADRATAAAIRAAEELDELLDEGLRGGIGGLDPRERRLLACTRTAQALASAARLQLELEDAEPVLEGDDRDAYLHQRGRLRELDNVLEDLEELLGSPEGTVDGAELPELASTLRVRRDTIEDHVDEIEQGDPDDD